LLARAWVDRIQPGIESLSTRILGLMNKGCTSIQSVHLLREALARGIDVVWNFLIGVPGEKLADYLTFRGWSKRYLACRRPRL